MQDFIEFLKRHNELKVIDEPLDIELEIPHLAYLEVKKKDSKALLFTHPVHRIYTQDSINFKEDSIQNATKNSAQDSNRDSTQDSKENSNKNSTQDSIPDSNITESKNIESSTLDSKNSNNPNSIKVIKYDIPVLMNIFGSFNRLNLIATHYRSKGEFSDIESIARAIKSLLNPAMPKGFSAKLHKLLEFFNARHIFPKKYRTFFGLKPAACQEIILRDEKIDLFSLPILKTWEEDGGRFITMGQVYTKSLVDSTPLDSKENTESRFYKTNEFHNLDSKKVTEYANKDSKNENIESKLQGNSPKNFACNPMPHPPTLLENTSETFGRISNAQTTDSTNSQNLDSKTPNPPQANNVGMYRLQVKSKNELLMHWQIHKDATHFFHEYAKKNKKMPVSIAIGGDPLYIWCAQAPMPPKMFELLLFGLIRGSNARLAKCVSNELSVPHDSDIVIEGYVDTSEFAPEGKFGDHTGFYTPIEPYPVLKVTAITMKKRAVYLATVVGKPPLEDKFMGYMTERVFLPLLQTSVHGLLDYSMPENGVFHNLILARVRGDYPGESLQVMHAFFGLGQLSFVKHAIFLNSSAPNIHSDYKILSDYILDRVDVTKLHITQGICDALDHACESYALSGKLGIDACGAALEFDFKQIDSVTLLNIMQNIVSEIVTLRIYPHKNPLVICRVAKRDRAILGYAEKLCEAVCEYTQFVIFIDGDELENDYMLLWRIVNSIDVSRDLRIESCKNMGKKVAFLDATSKSTLEGYTREWPKDVVCSKEVIESLKQKGLVDVDDEFLQKFGIL